MSNIDTAASSFAADYSHAWRGGMCVVDPEDLADIAATGRMIECASCDAVYPTRELCPSDSSAHEPY